MSFNLQQCLEKLDYSVSFGKMRKEGKDVFILTDVENPANIICKESNLEDLFSPANDLLIDSFLVSQCCKRAYEETPAGSKSRIFNEVFELLHNFFVQRVLGKNPDTEILVEELLRIVILVSARADLFWKLYNKRR